VSKKKAIPDAPPLTPTPDCELCRSINRASYHVMRRLHASDEEISEAAQVSIEQVMRHFRVCVPIIEDSAEDVDAVSASDTELQNKLLVDSNELCFATTLAVR
jgi:hypothetical protein